MEDSSLSHPSSLYPDISVGDSFILRKAILRRRWEFWKPLVIGYSDESCVINEIARTTLIITVFR